MIKKFFLITITSVIIIFTIIALIGFAFYGASIFIWEVAEWLSISRTAVLIIVLVIGLIIGACVFAADADDSGKGKR